MNTKILAGILAVVVLGAGAWYVMNNTVAPESSVTNDEEQIEDTTPYTSEELGVSFEYPAHYNLDTQVSGNTTTLVLIDNEILAEYEQSGAMEGPPSITVQVLENTEGYEVEEWITQTPSSNYQLATDPTMLEGEVAGEPARAYQHSGLYETNAVVVAHEGKVYMFTVSWLTEEDQNLTDFGNLLESVRFN